MNTEIEARFLEIDKQALIDQLHATDAVDKGEVLLNEIIFYDNAGAWENRFVRLRSSGSSTILTYKHNQHQTIDSATEIELSVSDAVKATLLLEAVGLAASRHQEKYRHTFVKDGVTIDIDTWPKIPPYVEFEGPSEKAIRKVAASLGFDWSKAVFDDARAIISKHYDIPVADLHWFTFDRCE